MGRKAVIKSQKLQIRRKDKYFRGKLAINTLHMSRKKWLAQLVFHLSLNSMTNLNSKIAAMIGIKKLIR